MVTNKNTLLIFPTVVVDFVYEVIKMCNFTKNDKSLNACSLPVVMATIELPNCKFFFLLDLEKTI